MVYKTYKIADLIEEIAMGPFGSNIKVECFVDEGVPVLNGSNVDGFALSEKEFRYVTPEKAASLKKANASRGDVVITHRGTLGQIVYIPLNSKYEQYVISQSQFRVRCNERILPEYMVYYFHTNIGQHKLLSNASQVGVPALARPSSTFQQIEIDIPDIDTQKRVIAVINAIQEKININTKINDNLQQQVYALFDSWFVSFDQTDGNMPADWREGTLGEITTITSGKRPPMKQPTATNEVSIPLVGAASIMGFTNAVLYNEPILVTGRVGTHGVVQRFQSPCWTSDNTLVIKSEFYEYAFQALQRVDYVNMNRGSTQPLITQTDLKNVSIVIPTEAILLEYEKIAGTLMAMYESNRKENERLAVLRDTLLPRLMNGETDVSNIEI